jgi:hypothetical protein
MRRHLKEGEAVMVSSMRAVIATIRRVAGRALPFLTHS